MVTKTYPTVNLNEIDSLGIVHHINYPVWFESARRDYFKKAGIPNSIFTHLGIFLPLSNLKCEFKSPARYDDKIFVATRVAFMSCAKMKFAYTVASSNTGIVIAAGETVHAWTNKNMKLLNIKNAAPEIYEKLETFSDPKTDDK